VTALTHIAQSFAEQLPVCLLGGFAAALLAAAILRMTARHNAGARFRVWFAALLAITGLLFFGGVRDLGRAFIAQSHARALFELPVEVAVYGFIAWMVLATLALVRVGVGVWHVYRIRQSCVPVDVGSLDDVVSGYIQRRIARRVSLCVSDRVTVPTAIGLFRPAIVMPEWALSELSPLELQQVVLHELAHLQRWDDWTNLGQKIVRALLIFHPVVWWLESKLTLERELACDDAVVRQTQKPGIYARCLATIAEKSFARRSVALVQAAVGHVTQTTLRVSRMLTFSPPAEQRHPALHTVAAGALISLAGLLAVSSPKILGFDEAGVAESPVVRAATSPSRSFVQPVSLRSVDRQVSSRSVEHVLNTQAEPLRLARRQLKQVRSAPSIHSRPNATADMLARYLAPDRPMNNVTSARWAQSSTNQRLLYSDTVLVVVDSTFNSRPAVLWQLTVWRVTVHADGNSITKDTTPRKT